MNWDEFQGMFVERWYRQHMAPLLHAEADPLVEYTEPINSRIARKQNALPEKRRAQVRLLVERHMPLGVGFMPLYAGAFGAPVRLDPPELPLRESINPELARRVPDGILDAPALRPLLDRLIAAYRSAIAEFDEAFGERA